MGLFAGLNPAQKEAVDTLSGPLLVLAGAGSGKTKTLTHRIANLIAHGTDPANILAVTFTNKAAREMRDRLYHILYGGDEGALTPRSFMPYMGTFHGICVKILRIEAAAAGLDTNFVIYDTDDQISLIKRAIKTLKFTDDKTLKPKSIQSIISKAKNEGLTPDDYAATALYPNQKRIAKIFARYESDKKTANALDFDDLLLRVLELLQNHSEIRTKWQDKFHYILIDEYQDTNMVQYQLIKMLVGKERNICVVGDDWQSIYSWRGADFTNILHFERDFPGAKVIKLEQNYRSTGNILEMSQRIINQNKTRTDKVLFTEAEQGEPVDIIPLRDEDEEAHFVARKILEYSRTYPHFSDFAVLYRTNAQSYTFEKVFINMHIPYKIVGGVRFYDRKEVKDVLAILKLLVCGRDQVSLERITKNVLSGIGEASLAKIFNAMNSMPDAEPLKNPDLPDVLSGKARESFTKLTNFIKNTPLSLAPAEITKKAVEHFNFEALLRDGTPTGEERIDNLSVLIGNTAGYETLEDFLADATLMSSADESTDINSVTLMTMHAAKGLEFPVVFLVGLEEGLFPSARAEDEAALEEERRLAYVGMTRAMKKLFMTYAMSRFSYGGRTYNTPSRFLTELGYNPYGSNQFSDNDSYDNDNDGFKDYDAGSDFNEDDFDPFPEDLPFFD
jgi:DNA helicase-2/ATP-dependent DNA helicase PcrA